MVQSPGIKCGSHSWKATALTIIIIEHILSIDAMTLVHSLKKGLIILASYVSQFHNQGLASLMGHSILKTRQTVQQSVIFAGFLDSWFIDTIRGFSKHCGPLTMKQGCVFCAWLWNWLVSFFINLSILYQRGIYPAESFKREQHYDLTLFICDNKELQEYLSSVLKQLKGKMIANIGFLLA